MPAITTILAIGLPLLAVIALIVVCLVVKNKKKAPETPAEKAPDKANETTEKAAPAPAETAAAKPAPAESAEAPVANAEAPAKVAPVAEATPAPEKTEGPAAEEDAEGETNVGATYSDYKKSFTARLIQSANTSDDLQGYYEALKNALLSYKGVSARVSWNYESFKCGRKQLAKFAIRGKTLCLFLALDPAGIEGTKYNIDVVDDAKKYADVPCRLRLTSKRSIKWGVELIDKLAEAEGLVKDPKFKERSYRMPYESTEALLEKGLVKKAV